MSRFRRRSADNDSLELLLDTICNTFGGIVFIALLVSVLISQTTAEVSVAAVEEAKQAELQRVAAELDASLQTLDQLKKSGAILERISRMIDDPKMKSMLIRKENLQNAIERLQAQVGEDIVEVSNEQAKVNEKSNSIAQAKKMLDAAKMELAQVESELKDSVKDNSRVFGFPIAQSTRKRQYTLAIKNNKICFFEKKTSTGVVDDPEQAIESGNFITGITLTPRFENGIPFNASDTSEIERRIKSFEADSFYATVFIWDDSIEAFQTLSELLISNQTKYEVVTMSEKSTIIRGGRQGMVQ